MDALAKEHMDRYHKLDPKSDYYYQPFTTNRGKVWLKHDYPSCGLQGVNTRTFRDAFMHRSNVPLWGWSKDYLDILAARLRRAKKISAFDLAVWLYRSEDFEEGLTPRELIQRFLRDYSITEEEQSRLFSLREPKENAFEYSTVPATWDSLGPKLLIPPDAQPERGGSLGFLKLVGTGPSKEIAIEPAHHLTLVTGDNGLGKTFLLDCAWWALTGAWADQPALPNSAAKKGDVAITFSVRGQSVSPELKRIPYNWASLEWQHPAKRPTIAGLIVYARVDGSFAAWDPVKWMGGHDQDGTTTLSSAEVWDGRKGHIEGLIRDWGRWQSNSDSSPFRTFEKVLKGLSPPDLGTLTPGTLTRIPNDPRDIPTVKHQYGETPVPFVSASVKRILALAYLMVWAWSEHSIASEQMKRNPERRMVILVDEIEAHLHPKWQRLLLPALVSVVQLLREDLEVQLIVTTHSPLVLASLEEIFNQEEDALYHFGLDKSNLTLEKQSFIKLGNVSHWLTSPIFELRHARSHKAEEAIESAKDLQMHPSRADEQKVRTVTDALLQALPDDDMFWLRWVGFAEEFGVEV